MKTLGANRCLLIATLSLVTAMLPLAGVAQEEPSDMQVTTPPAVPQQRYVSDKLVLNVYAEPDQGSSRVATIQTGDAVEELERSGNLVRVRLEDGREGWVGSSYLTSEAPAAVRLRELQRQQKTAPGESDKKLTDEIARLKKENLSLQTQVKDLQLRPIAPVAPPPEDGEQLIGAEAAEVVSNVEVAGPVPTRGAWWIWPIAVVLSGGLGYVGGYQSLARRLRKKFGGLKVY